MLLKRELQVKKAEINFKINVSEILSSKTRRPGVRDFSSPDIENIRNFSTPQQFNELRAEWADETIAVVNRVPVL